VENQLDLNENFIIDISLDREVPVVWMSSGSRVRIHTPDTVYKYGANTPSVSQHPTLPSQHICIV